MTEINKCIELPLEMFNALIYIGLPKSEMSCVMFIIKKTIGWGKKRDEIAISQFTKATGLPKSSIFRALDELKKKRIIITIKNETRTNITYGINSRIQNWIPVKKLRKTDGKSNLALKNETDHRLTIKNNRKYNKNELSLKNETDHQLTIRNNNSSQKSTIKSNSSPVLVSKMRLHNNTSICHISTDSKESVSSASDEAQPLSNKIRKSKIDLIPKKKDITLTKKQERIFDYYYQEHFKKQPSLNTKSALKARTCLYKISRGTLFDNEPKFSKYHGRKFTEKEIKLAIDRHILKATNNLYRPVNKEYMFVYLADFFYNRFSKVRSLFIDSLENPPVLLSSSTKYISDHNPELSEALFKLYNEEARNGMSVQSFDKLDAADKNCFTLGAFKLNKFLKMNSEKIIGAMVNTQKGKAKLLWSTILMCAKKDLKKISPFWFKADFIFERLPVYMKDRGYLSSTTKRSAFKV